MSEKIKITEDFLRELPKVELHCHLDGSLRIESMIDLAAKDKVNLPTSDPDSAEVNLLRWPPQLPSKLPEKF